MFIGIAVTAITIVAFAFIGCEKDLPSSTTNTVHSSNQRNGGNNSTQTINSLVSAKAYLAAFDPTGICSGPPNAHHNASITYFTGSSGASQTIVNDELCYTSGIGWDPHDCTMYLTVGTSTSGSSDLYIVNSNGTVTYVGAIYVSGTTPLYVEEMEFDSNGDMYMVAQVGGNWELYKISNANLGNATNVATHIGTILTNTRSQHYLVSLSRNPSTDALCLTYEASNNSTNTFYSVLSKTTAGLSSTVTCTGTGTINSADFATYYFNGTLYFARSGNLYTLPASNGSASSAGSLTMNVENDMTFMADCNN